MRSHTKVEIHIPDVAKNANVRMGAEAREVKIPTLSHRTREGWGTLACCGGKERGKASIAV